jgi:hypothetical protein
MTRYQFSITIPANGAAALNFAAQAFLGAAGVAYPSGWQQAYGAGTLSCTRLEAYMDVGGTGSGYVGPSNVTHLGANKAYALPPASSTAIGGYVLIQSYEHANVNDLAQFSVHGSNPGDAVVVVYYQA